jgi:outer membrane biosynthesis protein TonB
MADIDSLPADQRAALQLLIKQGQSYDQLASLLGIGPDAVRGRAHAAVAALGPDTDLSDSDRGAVADYLLGQQSPSERDETRLLIAGSDSVQSWARGAADALAPLAGDGLPDIPSAEVAPPAAREPEPEPEPAYEREVTREPEPEAAREPEPAAYEEAPAAYEEAPTEEAPAERAKPARPPRPSSRLGGALLLGGLGIIVAVVLILIINGGGDDSSKKSSSTLSSNPSTQTTPGGQQRPIAQVNLTSASGNSRQVGLAQVFENGNRRAVIVAGQGLAPGAYALWLYNSGSDAKLLGFVPERVGKDGRFATQGELSSVAEKFKQLVVTKENVTNNTKKAPTTPGQVVLQGDLKLG